MQITRIDHFSFTVGDLDRSTEFYGRLGWEHHKEYLSNGPDVDDGADTPNADMKIRWLKHSTGGPMLELIRYLNYDADRSAHNSRVGAAHMCFVVEDVRQAHRDLTGEGVQALSDPHEDAFGVVWVYFRDPDGNAVELIQDPPA